MKYKKTTLKNGLRIFTVPMKGTQTATVMIMVGVGSRYEKEGEAGLSHFIEHMFFKGTEKRPSTLDIAVELDSIGGEYNAFTGKDVTGYYAKVDSKHLNNAIDIVSDIYLNSKIDAQEIEKERGTIIQEISMYEDSPMSDVDNVFERLLYKNNPLGQDVIGSKKTVAALKRKNFIDHMNRFYTANDTVIGVAGKFDEKSVITSIEKHFLKMKKGLKPKIKKVTEMQIIPAVKVKHKKTDQTHLILGVRAYNNRHKDRFALSLLAVILGGNMSSRIFIEVREKLGLAYYVRTYTSDYQDCGYIATQAGVDHKKLGVATKAILQEYKRIANEKVSSQELKKAKDYIRGKSVMGLESTNAVVTFFIEQELMKRKVMTMDDIFRKIDKVSIADIQRVAKDIFQNRKLNLAIIGPHKNIKEIKKLLKV